jgi:hypothetical protein
MGRRKRKRRSSYAQKFLILVMAMVLALCVTSVTYGFFIRRGAERGAPGSFRIEILNGTGEKGLARRAAVSMMKRGIDVFKVANADRFDYKESVLIARRRNDQLRLLGEALGCENVVEQTKRGSFVDATLIIGADYEKLNLGLESDSGLFH